MYAISRLTDPDQIREYLLTDANYAAYALGDLEPPYSAHAHWYAASRTGAVEGLALVYTALDPAVLFLMGSTPALSALLLWGVGPDKIFLTIQPEMQDTFAKFYRVEHLFAMFRMRVTKGIFVPLSHIPPEAGLLPLHDEHIPEIRRLLEITATTDGRDPRDIAFEPDMLKDGYYRGIFNGDQLIAVAGTHVVAPKARMAAVGNVATHPDYRRQGMASLVSYAVTQALIDDNFDLIVLNVRQNNQPALKVYRKLGYKQVGGFLEGLAERR